MKTPTEKPATGVAPLAPAYNGKERNAFIFGFSPQAEIWNGRLAMIGFVAYLVWDYLGFSVLRDVLRLLPPLPPVTPLG